MSREVAKEATIRRDLAWCEDHVFLKSANKLSTVDLVELARLASDSVARRHADVRKELVEDELSSIELEAVIHWMTGFLRGWLKCFQHHGAPKSVLCSLAEAAAQYLFSTSESQFISKGKYLSAYLMSKFLRNELPENPSTTEPMFRGSGRRWLRARLVTYNRKNIHLFWSLVQAKRSAYAVSDEIVLENLWKHSDAMTQFDRLDATLRLECLDLLRPIVKGLRRKIDFKTVESMNGSTSASFEQPRQKGGAAVELRVLTGLENDLSYSIELRNPDLVRMSTSPSAVTDRGFVSMPLTSTYVNLQAMERWQGSFENKLIHSTSERKLHCAVNEIFGGSPARDFSNKIYQQALLETATDNLHCRVAVVIEPFKIRTVTAGPAASYHLSQIFQKSIHRILRRMPCFRLIGRVVSPTDLFDLRYSDGILRKWFSGDYRASTDNLSSSYSMGILDDLMHEIVGEDWHQIFRACLKPQWCHYPPIEVDYRGYQNYCLELRTRCQEYWRVPVRRPDGSVYWLERGGLDSDDWYHRLLKHHARGGKKDGCWSVKIPAVLQNNAQLMGSRLSFPQLCLANLGLYLRVKVQSHYEDFEKEPTRKQMWGFLDRVLINGDDILFAATPREDVLMREYGMRVGLEMSVGKTYYHERYANINSTCFDCDVNSGELSCRLIPYLNTGLFFGQNKVLSTKNANFEEDSIACFAPHIAVLAKVVDGAVSGKQCELLAEYLVFHKEALQTEARGRNLFIHQSLGGWGVPAPATWRYSITEAQKAEVIRILQGGCFTASCGVQRSPQHRQLVEDTFIEPWYSKQPASEPRLRPKNPGRLVSEVNRYSFVLECGIVPARDRTESI